MDTTESIQKLKSHKGLKLLHLNVRSLFLKIDQCRIAFEDAHLDIMTLSETWLNNSIPTSAVDLANYSSLRLDRKLANTNKKRGGGLITYVHQKHQRNIVELPEISVSNKHCEALWTRVNMTHCKDIIVCNIYRPPGSNLKSCIDYLESSLSRINLKKVDIFIMGDLNVDFSDKKSVNYKKLLFFLKANQLTQRIKESTRITQMTTSILDLVITNCKHVYKVGTLPNFLSDHQPVYIVKKKARDHRAKESFTGWSYRELNMEQLKLTLANKDWNTLLDSESIEESWQTLLSEIRRELDLVCPIKKFTVRSQRPKWMNNDLIEQMKDRDYYYKKAKRTGNEDDWNIAKHLRNITNFNVRQAKANFITGELNANSEDPKKFWRIIKSVFPGNSKKNKTSVSLNDDRNQPVDTEKIPDYINNFFINIGRKIAQENCTMPGSGPVLVLPNSLTNRTVEEREEEAGGEEELFEISEVREADVLERF